MKSTLGDDLGCHRLTLETAHPDRWRLLRTEHRPPQGMELGVAECAGRCGAGLQLAAAPSAYA